MREVNDLRSVNGLRIRVGKTFASNCICPSKVKISRFGDQAYPVIEMKKRWKNRDKLELWITRV